MGQQKSARIHRYYTAYPWLGSTEYSVTADGVIEATGEDHECFRLDSTAFYEGLLRDFLNVKTASNVMDWVELNGFVTKQKTVPIAEMLRRAASVRWLTQLHEAVMQSAQDLDHEPLLTMHTSKKRGETVSVEFPALEESYPLVFDDLAMPWQPWFGRVMPHSVNDWNDQREYWLRFHARMLIMEAIKSMLQNTSISLILMTDESECTEPRLEPAYAVHTPWQAMGIALMKEVCAETFEQRFCESCQTPIFGRSDKRCCGNETCRKRLYRNRMSTK